MFVSPLNNQLHYRTPGVGNHQRTVTFLWQ